METLTLKERIYLNHYVADRLMRDTLAASKAAELMLAMPEGPMSQQSVMEALVKAYVAGATSAQS